MVMVEVFSLILGMSIPWCGKIGKGKFPQSWLSRVIHFYVVNFKIDLLPLLRADSESFGK